MILSDYEIEKLCTGDKPMISPFVGEKTRMLHGKKVPSFGLSSYGYDIRLSNKFAEPVAGFFDPMNAVHMDWVESEENKPYYLLPANSSVLAVSVERFHMPPNVTGLCTGKSTYARCFLVTHMTPLEAGWEGYLTLEFTNPAKHPVLLYIGAGVAQIQFFKGARCKSPYGNGIYQGQGAAPVVGGGKS